MITQDKINKEYILVTGSAGFIGFHLSKRLLEQGVGVIGLDNMNDYYDVGLKKLRIEMLSSYSDFQFVKADVYDRKCLDHIMKEYPIKIIIHLAAQAGVRYSILNPDTYMNSNIMGFYNILECSRHNQVKHLLFASSSSVYGLNEKIPFSTEDKVDKPASLYAATKASNELMAYSYSHLFQIPVTALRFFTVYGPFGRPDMAYFSFADAIMKGTPIKIFNHGDMYRDFTYIDDVVECIQRLIGHTPKEDASGTQYKVYNIGNNKPVKLMYFISLIEKYLGKSAIKEFLPMQPGDVYQTYADITDIVKDIDYQPLTSIEEGLESFVSWYKTYQNL